MLVLDLIQQSVGERLSLGLLGSVLAYLAIVENHTIGVAGDQIPIVLREFETCYSCLTAFDFTQKVLTLLSIQVKYPKRVIEIAADVKPVHLVGVDLEYILKILADPLIPQLQIEGLT
jgi:hypothetical protein